MDEPLAGAPRLAVTPAFPTAVRIIIDVEPLLDDRRAATLDRLEGRLRAHEARSTPVWLVISSPGAGRRSDGGLASGRAIARLTGRHTRELVRIALLPQPDASGQPAPRGLSDHGDSVRVAAFALKRAAVELRAVSPAVRVMASGPPAPATWLEALYREEVGSYLDGIALAADDERRLVEAAALVQRHDPGAIVAVTGVPIDSADSIVSTSLARLGGPIAITSFQRIAGPRALRARSRAAHRRSLSATSSGSTR